MTKRPARAEFDAASSELRLLLRAWDPLGAFQDEDPELHAPPDEYDCLIPGLYSRLRAGADEDELFTFLEHELVAHFGVSPHPQGDRCFVRRLAAWWAQWRRSR